MQPMSMTQRNIREICRIEQEALHRRSRFERVGDLIASHAGRLWFIAAHLAWFTTGVLNTPRLSGRMPFDPFPFSLLTMFVSLETIFSRCSFC